MAVGTDWTASEVMNDSGRAPLLLVCEHASLAIPDELDELGLSPEARRSHIAWDIGARDVALSLAERMDAPLVSGALSRLVYDCNRPPEAGDAIPERSEAFEVPGNRALDETARAERVARVHDPFHASVEAAAEGRAALITIHSFTPVFHGARRAVEIGFLFHSEGRLAEAAMSAEAARGRYHAALNEPYAPSDGVTYTLQRHGEDKGLPALMVEIRNDLIDAPEAAMAMAEHLSGTLSRALDATLGEATA